MKKVPAFLTLLVVVFLVAAAASIISLSIYGRRELTAHHDAHAWIHSQLALTEAQEKALEPIEKKYRDRSAALEREMQAENAELARVILQDRQDSERVRACIERIHDSMGELQNVTIGHVFEMRAVLTPSQYDRLLKLTADALSNLDSAHAGQ